eukprot:TRINITY_DN4516_c0_g1_i1.p1 TRINITY_DN4516_c0_g1~~TRINITY_DN4516_c0_g1_i1.p1  ORF type:complete len:164 (+),score=39.77 TRINITY_DN4516_c0_g1_i1:89-580(+)
MNPVTLVTGVAKRNYASYMIKQFMDELEFVYSIATGLLKDIPDHIKQKAPDAIKYTEATTHALRKKLDSMVCYKEEARKINKEEKKKIKEELAAEGKNFKIARTFAKQRKQKIEDTHDSHAGPVANAAIKLIDPWKEWENLEHYQSQVGIAMQMLTTALILYK